MEDIFKLQDEIATQIAKAMQIHTTEGEITKTRFKNIPDLQTYIKVLKAFKYFFHNTKESNILARKEAEELRALNPEITEIYSLLGSVLGSVYVQGIALGTCECHIEG